MGCDRQHVKNITLGVSSSLDEKSVFMTVGVFVLKLMANAK